jgi:RimJ/RimL family protein N-acetyltransferase
VSRAVGPAEEDVRVQTPPELISAGPVDVRRPRLEDLAGLLDATQASWEHLRPWMPWAHERATPESQRPWLVTAVEEWETRDAFQFVVVERATGTLVGSCGLMRRIGVGGLEIGYWLHVDHVGRGFMTNAAAALTRAGLRLESIDHVEIHCDAANVASAAVPARLGYTLVDTRASDITAPGQSGRQQVWRFDARQDTRLP